VFPVGKMCEVLKVSRSSFIIGRKESLLCDQKEELFYLRRSSLSIIGAVADMEAPDCPGTGIKRNKGFSPFCCKADEGKRFEKYCKEEI
jgi:hypothetical protein